MRAMRFFALALGLALAACSSDKPAQICTPGATQACLCPGGVTGAQACDLLGSGYEECSCPGGQAGQGGSAGGGGASSGGSGGMSGEGGSAGQQTGGAGGATCIPKGESCSTKLDGCCAGLKCSMGIQCVVNN